MRRLLLLVLALLCLSGAARANQSARGWCESGAQVVITSGLVSTTNVQASYPSCTVTVFVHGSGVATVFSDNNATPTPLANPFTASTNGQWQFYAPNGHYDVQLSGAGFPSPVTYSDVYLNDAGAGGIVFGVYAAIPFSATPVFNAATASIFSITITGNVTAPVVNSPIQNGQVIEINVCQDAFGGHTWAWPANFQNTSFFTISSTPTTCTPTTWFYNGTVWQPFAGSSGGSTVVLPPSLGGTGTATPAAHGVAVGEGPSTAFNFILPTNNGQCFMSAPANFATTDPSYQTCPTGTGGTSAGPLGTIQEAGASAGTFAVSPLLDIGGLGTIVKNSADNEWCGANPYVDVRCYARIMPKNTTPVQAGITATCASGSPNVTLSGLPTTPLINGDGVNIFHCGASNSGTIPSASAVTPGGSAGGTGTRIVKPSAAPTLGSTTYTYQAVGVTRGRGYSLPSAVTTITTGAASLGIQTCTITTITASGQTATATCSAPHTMSAGYEINIAGVTDANGNGADAFWGGEYSVATVPDTTHITYMLRQAVANGAPTAAISGTITYTNLNHIAVTAAGGYDYYAIYGGSAGTGIACIIEPVNASLAGDQTYLACDDNGSTINGNFTVPEYLSATLPVAATNDSLTTTILSGSPAGAPTTSLTLNANAGASGTNTIHFDNGPNYVTAANAAIAIGAPLYFPLTTGNDVWFNSSYVSWPTNTKIRQAGFIYTDDTWNGNGTAKMAGLDGVPCSTPSFALLCAPQVFAHAAYPGFYRFSALDRITFTSGVTNNQSPLVLLDQSNSLQLNNLNFVGSNSASEYLFTGLECRGTLNTPCFPLEFNNISFIGGPNQVNSSVSTPLFFCNNCSTIVVNGYSVGRRGFVIRPGNGVQATFHFGYNQGGINPMIRTVYADNGSANVTINADNLTQDTTAMPIFSCLLNTSCRVNLINVGSPSSTSPGGVPPTVTGSVAFINALASNGLAPGTNITTCNSATLWDPAFNAAFTTINEAACTVGAQTNITPGYSIFTSDINITPPTCSTANAGPPFTPANSYTFQYAAQWFGGNLGTLSPKSASCTSNGSQQITVTMPSVPPTASAGWDIFWTIVGNTSGNPAGASFPSTLTSSYLFLLTNGGNAPTAASGGPAGMRNGQVWGDFFPNAPNNTANALLSISSGKLIATPCVPSATGDLCYWNGSAWTRFAGNVSGTQLFAESPSGVPSWVAQGAPFPPAGVPNSSGAAWLASYAAPTGNLVGTGQSNTWTAGVQDFSAVSELRPKAGIIASLPVPCAIPDIYFGTDAQPGRNWFFCTVSGNPGTWTQQLNTGFLGLNTYASPHTLLASETWANFTATTTATVPHANLTNSWVVYCVTPCATLTIAPDAGNITLNGAAAAATTTIGTGFGVEVSCDGANCFAWGLGGSGGGSGTVSSGTVNGMAYYTAATTVGSATPPTTPNGVSSFWTSTPSGGVSQPPASALPGIVGRAVSGAASTDTILSTDCNPNRVEYVGSAAVAVTLPTATTLAVPKCVFKLVNTTSPAQTVTITPTTWTINGAATLALTFGQQLWVYVDPNSATNWVADQTDLFGNVSGGAVPASAKLIGTNASAQLIAAALANTHIYVGSAGNLPVDVAASGDVTLANTGAFTVTGANGGTFPTSASLLGTNGSKQPVAATAHGVALTLACADTSGSGSAQVCNTSPTFTPVASDSIIYTTTTANTGAALTINVNSLGAKPVAKWQNSTTLAASDLKANVQVLLTYDGTNWELATIGNAPSGGGGTPCTVTALSLQYNNAGAFGCVTEFTYASSTITASSTGKLDLSAGSVTAGLLVPKAAAAAPTNAAVLSYDTTNNNIVWGNATNTSRAVWTTAATTSGFLPKWSGTAGLEVTSLCDEAITTANTLTCTNTAGIAAPKFTSTGTTAGFIDFPQGTTSSAVAPCNTATSICEQAPTSVTSYLVTKPGVAATGTLTNNVSAAVDTQGFSGDANHSATVTIGSGTSIGSTSLCSTGNCPVGTYRVNVYVDITTACGTSGTYVVNLIYTDDQGSKTIPVNINGTGAVPATGVLTTTSTANFGENAQIIRSTGAASINYSTTAVACGTAGPMVGKLYLSVEPVQ